MCSRYLKKIEDRAEHENMEYRHPQHLIILFLLLFLMIMIIVMVIMLLFDKYSVSSCASSSVTAFTRNVDACFCLGLNLLSH